MTQTQSTARRWWREGVCYQVWPLSFKDSNADGNGDIRGLIGKLDYLHDLGVDFIWLSPMYASPREDYGYDISDYQSVDPVFGTLQDMDDLIAEMRSRGMRLVLDLVINHTSSEHRWFKRSAESRDNEYSHYYTWRDPKIVNGKKCPPSNWRAAFGGSCWKYVEARDQYYLHIFLESMPDLNWEEADVRKAIYNEAIAFWLDRGVAGFRCDVVNFYSKNTAFPDGPVVDPTDEFHSPRAEDVINGPRIHEFFQEQRKFIRQYGEDIVLIGELSPGSMDDLKKILSPVNRELDMNFDTDIFVAGGPQWEKPWTQWKDVRSLAELRKVLTKIQGYISEYGLWSTAFFENHDQARSITSFGSRDAQNSLQSGKLLALLLTSMSGTMFIYQGQEIGMSNYPTSWKMSDMRDPMWLNFLRDADQKYPNDEKMHEKALEIFHRCNRDNARTPVQWSTEEPCAGFSTAEPWIRINENFRKGINVQDQLGVPDSLLEFWRRAISFRKSHAGTIIYGHSKFIDVANEHCLSIVKEIPGKDGKGEKLLVVLNYSDTARELPSFDPSELGGDVGRVLFGTGPGSGMDDLQPWEGRVFEV